MGDHPTCDLEGCDALGAARYRHVRNGEWIDVCGPHRPTGFSHGTPVHIAGSLIYYHTSAHAAYPAETPTEVSEPNTFKRRGPADG